MSNIPTDQISEKDKAILACSYALLILHDDKVDVTSEKIQKLLTKSNIKIEGYWAKLFAENMAGMNIDDLMMG